MAAKKIPTLSKKVPVAPKKGQPAKPPALKAKASGKTGPAPAKKPVAKGKAPSVPSKKVPTLKKAAPAAKPAKEPKPRKEKAPKLENSYRKQRKHTVLRMRAMLEGPEAVKTIREAIKSDGRGSLSAEEFLTYLAKLEKKLPDWGAKAAAATKEAATRPAKRVPVKPGKAPAKVADPKKALAEAAKMPLKRQVPAAAPKAKAPVVIKPPTLAKKVPSLVKPAFKPPVAKAS